MKLKSTSAILLGGLVLTGLRGLDAPAADPTEALRVLPFQGRLTDQNGNAVSNGVKVVQFKIYETPSGGAPVWGGEVHRTTVNGGLINVILGTRTPLPQTNTAGEFFFNKGLYLEITVDVAGAGGGAPDGAITSADPPMLPRQAILPVIFAKDAARSADSKLLAGRDWGSILVSGNDPANGKIRGDKIQDGGVNTAQLASSGVTSAKIAPNAISGSHVADGSLTGADIADSSITGADIADGSITGNDVAQRSLSGIHLAGNSVGSTELADDVAFNTLSSGVITAGSRLKVATSANTFPVEILGRMRIGGGDGQSGETPGLWLGVAGGFETVSFVGLSSDRRVGFWSDLGLGWMFTVDCLDGIARSTHGFATAQADLAENFDRFNPELSAGDVVSADPKTPEGLAKSSGTYDDTLLGVISTSPGFILGEKDKAGKSVPLVLTGRVPVKVCLENGPIRIGDYLTSSKKPGVAMKASEPGQVIGMAMENYGDEEDHAHKQIIVLVNCQWRGGSRAH